MQGTVVKTLSQMEFDLKVTDSVRETYKTD